MPRLNDFDAQVKELDQVREVALTRFKLTWQQGHGFMGFTEQEKQTRLSIIRKKDDALRHVLEETRNECRYYTLHQALIKNACAETVTKRDALDFQYEISIKYGFAQMLDRLEKQICIACENYTKEILESLEYYQKACKLRDEQLRDLSQDENQTQCRDKIFEDFVQRVQPFLNCIEYSGIAHTVESMTQQVDNVGQGFSDLAKILCDSDKAASLRFLSLDSIETDFKWMRLFKEAGWVDVSDSSLPVIVEETEEDLHAFSENTVALVTKSGASSKALNPCAPSFISKNSQVPTLFNKAVGSQRKTRAFNQYPSHIDEAKPDNNVGWRPFL